MRGLVLSLAVGAAALALAQQPSLAQQASDAAGGSSGKTPGVNAGPAASGTIGQVYGPRLPAQGPVYGPQQVAQAPSTPPAPGGAQAPCDPYQNYSCLD